MGKRHPIFDAPITIYLVGSKGCQFQPIKEKLSAHNYHLIDLDQLDQPVLSLIGSLENGWDKVNTINRTVLDLMAKDFEKNYLLVNELYLGKYDEIIFHQVKKMADMRGSLFLPVLLLPEIDKLHPLAKELKESRYYLALAANNPDQVVENIVAYTKTMIDDFTAQPDLICDEVIIDESENPASRAIIKSGVIEYNKRFLGEWKPSPFSLFIRNAEGNIIAGVCGDYIHIYTRINWTWVHEDFRSRGIGRRAMLAVEDFAKEKGCRYIQLDTMDFQAKLFYQKLGFWVVATLPNWIKGHDSHIMRKEIAS